MRQGNFFKVLFTLVFSLLSNG